MSINQAPGRLPYTPPTLVTYGGAVELTLGSKSVGSRQDGGGKSKTRTD